VIEIDGPHHDARQVDDRLRDGVLRSLGVRVLRFEVGQVMTRPAIVVERIRDALALRATRSPA
jgi:very-short-patch-repair endonuclease